MEIFQLFKAFDDDGESVDDGGPDGNGLTFFTGGPQAGEMFGFLLYGAGANPAQNLNVRVKTACEIQAVREGIALKLQWRPNPAEDWADFNGGGSELENLQFAVLASTAITVEFHRP